MTDGYRIIQNGPDSFSVEGLFRRDGEQRFTSASGFKTEADALKWVYNRQAKEWGSTSTRHPALTRQHALLARRPTLAEIADPPNGSVDP